MHEAHHDRVQHVSRYSAGEDGVPACLGTGLFNPFPCDAARGPPADATPTAGRGPITDRPHPGGQERCGLGFSRGHGADPR
jgi:hypothetical protein